VGGLCEVLHPLDGVGELALVLPALARLARDPLRPVVWVAPPYWPFAPALRAHGIDLAHVRVIQAAPQQALWAAEQCLRAGCCAAVLVWPQRIDGTALRRLQLAAETGRCHAFVFRDARHAGDASPAPLRLAVRREQGQPVIRVIKCRGLLAPPAHELKMVPGTIPPQAAAARAHSTLASVPREKVPGTISTETVPPHGRDAHSPAAATAMGTAGPTEAATPATIAPMANTAATAPVTGNAKTATAPTPAASGATADARAAAAHRHACAARLPSLHAVAEAALTDSDGYCPDAGAIATAPAATTAAADRSKDPSP
jgi:cell division inhibitor SulA